MSDVPGANDIYITPPRRRTDNALIPLANGQMVFKKFIIHPSGLEVTSDVTQDEWTEFGNVIRPLEATISWVVGDWTLYAIRHWNATYAQIAELFGYEETTLETYASICDRASDLIRNQAKSFSHARLLVSLSQNEQVYWLEQTAINGWNVGQLKVAMRPKRGRPKVSPTITSIRKQARKLAQELDAITEDISDEDRQSLSKLFMKIARKIETQ